ncbi:hypothetical protein AAFC00_002539 [Neodothiora populina]|uniref:KOW domain-containing protein n=1 Tax=Neodothiora populina TaxID=2781224 RepID=A0ABR3P7V3_9PEZI
MQKLMQRTSAAQRQATRRAARQTGKVENAQEWQNRQQRKARTASQSMYIKNERERRREAYEAGSHLAPRYDVGEQADTYATVDAYILQGVNRTWRQYKNEICPFAEGDRVVVTQGKEKGKIGRITTMDAQAGSVKINGLNMGDWYVPEWARQEDADPRPIVAAPLPIPFSHIKLVHPLRDPETGVFKDTIIDKIVVRLRAQPEEPVEASPFVRREVLGWDPKTREYIRGRRFIPGLEQEMPWPETEDAKEETAHDDDTYRINVDEVTHRPYLLQPPMPPSVIDELRNKYSVFRTRHEDWYVARKEAEDRAVQQKKELARLVSTPTMELREKTRRERLDSRKDLNPDQLAEIGRLVAEGRRSAAKEVSRRSA